MDIQIKSFKGHQTSKVAAIMLAVFTLPFSLIGLIGFFAAAPMQDPSGQEMSNFPWLFFAFAPFFYGLFGYIFNRFSCFVYNLVAHYVGGIEFVTNDKQNL